MTQEATPEYYCIKCEGFVAAERGTFTHPHLGQRSCAVCRKCGGMVYLKEQEDLNAV